MKWFKSLEFVIQYLIIVAGMMIMYGCYLLLDKLIDKL
jgi:hypothetical protein